MHKNSVAGQLSVPFYSTKIKISLQGNKTILAAKHYLCKKYKNFVTLKLSQQFFINVSTIYRILVITVDFKRHNRCVW